MSTKIISSDIISSDNNISESFGDIISVVILILMNKLSFKYKLNI